MPGTLYPSSVPRALSDKLGERISVLDFGAVGDGTADNSAAFAAAIAAAAAAGGCEIFVPKGTYVLNSPVALGASVIGVSFAGDGATSIIKRGAALAAGAGLFDISGQDIRFESLTVEGAVTAAAGMLYSAITGGDPMISALTANTSFWVHGGATNIRFVNVTVRHTGGYALLVDARTADIADVRVIDCTFENNRPHLFGTASGDLNYGSWTGGIHWQGDGNSHAVHGLLVQGCTFRRNTGNCVWGHAYALNQPHTNVQVLGNSFEDCGLDAVEMGAVSGGQVESNHFRRIGYICTDDTSPSVPKWKSGGTYAVALDTSGLVRGVNYKGNTFMSCNGGCMDLDGFGQGTVSGNTCIIPSPGEPEYGEDSIASFGPDGTGANWVYGCQPSNTQNTPVGDSDISITGNTFINMGGGAIRLFGSRNCYVQGNTIIHSPTANYPPISIGMLAGGGAYRIGSGNVVAENLIVYDPAFMGPAIFEDGTLAAFPSTAKNWVADNRLQGNCFEFQKDSNTASTTAGIYSTSANGLTTKSESMVQREGVGASAVLRTYQNLPSGSSVFQNLFDVLTATVGGVVTPVGGPLFNVSNNGAAGSGSFSTGGRTQSLIDDAVMAGKLYADAFLLMTDATLTYPNDSKADLFPNTFGLLRFNSAAHIFEQSVSVSGGHRVWSALGGGSITGADKQIQYNASGSFGASSLFWYDYANSILNVANASALTADTAAKIQTSGYVYSAIGFNTPGTAQTAIQAPSGGVTAKWLIASDSLFFLEESAPALSGPGQARIYADPSHTLKVSINGGAYTAIGTGGGTVPGGSNSQIQYNASGSFGASSLFWYDAANIILNVANASALTADTAAKIQTSGYIYSSLGYYSPCTNTDTFQAPSGGMTAKWLVATDSLFLQEESAPAVSGPGQARIYADTSHNLYASINGGAYTALAKVAGSNTQIQFNNSGVLGADYLLSYIAANAILLVGTSSTLTADTTAKIQTSGYAYASVGFNTPSTATSAIQAPSGGVTAKWLIGTVSLTLSGTTAATAGAAAGRMYFDGSHFYVCEDGSSWARITGLTAGGANTQVLYNSGGAIAGSAAFTWNSASQLLTVYAASSGSAGIAVATGFIQSDAGFYATSGTATSFQSINAPTGGLYGRSLRAVAYTQVGSNSGAPTMTTGDSLQYGALYYDTGAGAFKGYTSAGWSTLISGAFVSSLQGYSGALSLANGTGISISGLTIANTGVTAIYGGTGISVNSTTGAVTITNTGSTYTAGTGVTISSNQISIGQAVGTGNNVTFNGLTVTYGVQINQSSGYGLYLPYSYVYANGLNSFSTANNGIQSAGGVTASNGFYIGGTQVINNLGQFCGPGVSCPSYGVQALGFNPTGYTGQSYTLYFPGGFQISGTTFYNLQFQGGVFVRAY